MRGRGAFWRRDAVDGAVDGTTNPVMPDSSQGDDPRRDIIRLLPELRAYARFLVRQPSEADDLLQEAVARALAALQQYQGGTSLRAWSFTIVRNLFYEQARRRRVERRALERSGAGQEWAPPAQDGHLDLSDLTRGLFTLPPLLREALVLVGAQGMSHEEAAAICAVPVGTMKARVSRARTQLARVMQARELVGG